MSVTHLAVLDYQVPIGHLIKVHDVNFKLISKMFDNVASMMLHH